MTSSVADGIAAPPAPDPFALGNPAAEARIGIGRGETTPATNAPINNWGAASTTRATGTAQSLTATVMIIENETGAAPDAGGGVVLVALDLGWWRGAAGEATIRAAVADQLGIASSQVLLSLSHTHAGPAIDPPADVIEQAQVRDYLDLVSEVVRGAAVRARADLSTALLEWGRGSCHLGWVRDQWLAGEHRYVCGLDPARPGDPMMLVGRVVGPGGVRAVIVNYACHPTTLGPGNSAISADYVGVARELVEADVGAPMLFLQGASGELAPRRQYQSGDEDGLAAVRANGLQLGHAILSTLAGMLPAGHHLIPGDVIESGAPLGTWVLEPVARFDRSISMTQCVVAAPPNGSEARWGSSAQLPEHVRAERDRRAALVRSVAGREHLIPVTACRLGQAVLIAHPGEAYSDLQRHLRAQFPDRPVVVANLTGGAHHGYLPPAELYERDLYQVWQSPAGPGSLELVRDASAAMIGELFAAPNPSQGINHRGRDEQC